MDMFYVWTGTELLIWGGYDEVLDQGCNCIQPGYSTNGAKFNPATSTWTPISNQNAPSPASSYATEYAGGCWMFFYKGGRVSNVSTNTWAVVANPGVQLGDYGPSVVKAIGDKIMVWGSSDDIFQKAADCHPVGGVWDPFTNDWTLVNENEAPLRSSATPVWTGTELLVASSPLADDPAGSVVVSRYNPSQQGFGQAAAKTLYLYKKN
jgi:hypothetical protein